MVGAGDLGEGLGYCVSTVKRTSTLHDFSELEIAVGTSSLNLLVYGVALHCCLPYLVQSNSPWRTTVTTTVTVTISYQDPIALNRPQATSTISFSRLTSPSHQAASARGIESRHCIGTSNLGTAQGGRTLSKFWDTAPTEDRTPAVRITQSKLGTGIPVAVTKQGDTWNTQGSACRHPEPGIFSKNWRCTVTFANCDFVLPPPVVTTPPYFSHCNRRPLDPPHSASFLPSFLPHRYIKSASSPLIAAFCRHNQPYHPPTSSTAFCDYTRCLKMVEEMAKDRMGGGGRDVIRAVHTLG
ncbi:hypothetical protein NMY22_g1752 [Coprinellus aureogranulatus]|nr:hypothetical protein NMY22_g1752 [Coprinellus aureogranulatus]